jgi:hypothetical protein
LVAVVPRPPPNWPTITSEVGTVFVPVPAGKDRLFVRLMMRAWPVGTVITTGDHVAAVVDAGFNAMQVAVAPGAAVPQLYPHIGTVEPSAMVTVVGPAVRLMVC